MFACSAIYRRDFLQENMGMLTLRLQKRYFKTHQLMHYIIMLHK